MRHGTWERYDEGCRCGPCVNARLDHDWLLYGETFTTRGNDGCVVRIDPTTVIRP